MRLCVPYSCILDGNQRVETSKHHSISLGITSTAYVVRLEDIVSLSFGGVSQQGLKDRTRTTTTAER